MIRKPAALDWLLDKCVDSEFDLSEVSRVVQPLNISIAPLEFEMSKPEFTFPLIE